MTQSELDVIHHAAIPVTDVAASVVWYQQHFRCAVAYQDTTWALLKFANVSLALVTPGQHPPHLGVLHEHAEQFGELTTHRDNTRSIYVPDPDGNQIEIMDIQSVKR